MRYIFLSISLFFLCPSLIRANEKVIQEIITQFEYKRSLQVLVETLKLQMQMKSKELSSKWAMKPAPEEENKKFKPEGFEAEDIEKLYVGVLDESITFKNAYFHFKKAMENNYSKTYEIEFQKAKENPLLVRYMKENSRISNLDQLEIMKIIQSFNQQLETEKSEEWLSTLGSIIFSSGSVEAAVEKAQEIQDMFISMTALQFGVEYRLLKERSDAVMAQVYGGSMEDHFAGMMIMTRGPLLRDFTTEELIKFHEAGENGFYLLERFGGEAVSYAVQNMMSDYIGLISSAFKAKIEKAFAKHPITLSNAYAQGKGVKKDLKKAREILEEALKNGDHSVKNNLAYFLTMHFDEHKKAEKLIGEYLKKQPNNGAALDTMAMVQYHLNNLEAALNYSNRAVKLRPESNEVRENNRKIQEAYDAKRSKEPAKDQ